MDELNTSKDIITQNGVIVFLFVSTFVAFVFKGVPYLLRKFDDVTNLFAETIKQLQETHKADMKTISEVFIAQIRESNDNHMITHMKIEEVKKMLQPNKK